MLKMWRVWMCVGLIFFWLFAPLSALAAVSCAATSQPHSVTPGSTTTFQITVNNNGPANIYWIKVTRPSANFNITAASATGWLAHRTATNVVFDTGTLAPGAGITLSVKAAAANLSAPAANWQVQSSEDSEGAAPGTCSGDTSTAIAALPPPPTISNINVTAITSSTATVNWSTDQPSSSIVRYGKTSSYGQNASGSANTTSHSVPLSGLAVGTNYHFQVESTNPGGTTVSTDNGFTTPVVPPGTTTTAAPAGPTSTAPTIARPAPNLQIKLNPLPQPVYANPPEFTGNASDSAGITVVEYSTDGGSNWLAATLSGPALSLDFKFTPANLPDGNYNVIARATNTRSEQALSLTVILVIDRLPPIIGGVLTAIGPQFLQPGRGNLLETVAGIEQRITLHALGGPTSITIRAYDQTNPSSQHSFSLSQIPGSNLWTAATSFSLPGRYRLEATAIDGANRQTDKALGEIIAARPIEVRSAGSVAKNAQATLYAWEPSLNNWVVWPAAAYGQSNPQVSDNAGQLRYFVPAGRYYLKIGGDYRSAVSDIITLDQAAAITGDVQLKKSWGIQIGKRRLSLPSILPSRFKIAANSPQPNAQAITNKRLDDFQLTQPKNQVLAKNDLAGRKTLLIYTPTWSPAAAEQLAILSGLDKDAKSRVNAFTSLEDPAAVQAYLSIAGYDLGVWLDANGLVSQQLQLIHTPTTVVIDKNGVVKTVMSGVLSKQAIIELLRSE